MSSSRLTSARVFSPFGAGRATGGTPPDEETEETLAVHRGCRPLRGRRTLFSCEAAMRRWASTMVTMLCCAWPIASQEVGGGDPCEGVAADHRGQNDRLELRRPGVAHGRAAS